MKPRVAIVRGKFLNQYEMQLFEPLTNEYDITAFGSLSPYHDRYGFPVVKLPSPMDVPEFPFKMAILNRLLVDAHYLVGLEHAIAGFDLIHTAETYFHYTQQCLSAKKAGRVKKVIATVLENIPFNNEGIWGRQQFKKRSREQLDHIIALTQKTKQALMLEGADPEKITVVAHGIDTERFIPSGDLHRRRGRRKGTFTILFCGRLEVYKGVYEILFAAKMLLSDFDLREFALHFVMVGDGSERQRLIEREAEMGISAHFFHKKVTYDQMPEVYTQADVFIAPAKPIPTYEEQYCTTLMEAQAMGLPIVATNCGGIPENVGDAAVRIPSADYIALARAIKNYILSPKLRTEFGTKARQRALSKHSSSVVSQQIAAVYQRILSS